MQSIAEIKCVSSHSVPTIQTGTLSKAKLQKCNILFCFSKSHYSSDDFKIDIGPLCSLKKYFWDMSFATAHCMMVIGYLTFGFCWLLGRPWSDLWKRIAEGCVHTLDERNCLCKMRVHVIVECCKRCISGWLHDGLHFQWTRGQAAGRADNAQHTAGDASCTEHYQRGRYHVRVQVSPMWFLFILNKYDICRDSTSDTKSSCFCFRGKK